MHMGNLTFLRKEVIRTTYPILITPTKQQNVVIQHRQLHSTKEQKVVIPNQLVSDILSQPSLALEPKATQYYVI